MSQGARWLAGCRDEQFYAGRMVRLAGWVSRSP